MQYSPKLKTAMAEIQKILIKHDIAGFVVLHTPQFSEYLNHLETSYSCAKMMNDGSGIRVRLKSAELGPERTLEVAGGTFNMIHHMAVNIAGHASVYMNIEKALQKQWDGEYLDGGGHTSHAQQNS